jgi:hypothetical protein
VVPSWRVELAAPATSVGEGVFRVFSRLVTQLTEGGARAVAPEAGGATTWLIGDLVWALERIRWQRLRVPGWNSAGDRSAVVVAQRR